MMYVLLQWPQDAEKQREEPGMLTVDQKNTALYGRSFLWH